MGWWHPKISGSSATNDSTDYALKLALFDSKVFGATFFQKGSESFNEKLTSKNIEEKCTKVLQLGKKCGILHLVWSGLEKVHS